MSSASVVAAARRADAAVVLPRLLVAAAQPYQTLAGPALTLHFLLHPQLLPFQRRHFAHAAVAPVYGHALLQSLAEFATTPRPVRDSHVKMLHAPMDDFWRSLGVVNCFYATAYPTRRRRHASRDDSNDDGTMADAATAADLSSSSLRRRLPPPTSAAAAAAPAPLQCAAHPTMGAVELVRASHRGETDVKMTLYDDTHTPLYTMLLTGPRCHARYEYTDDDARTTKNATTARARDGTHDDGDDAALVRTPLPYVAPPPRRRCGGGVHNDDVTAAAAALDIGDGAAPIVGGMYGELLHLRRGGGYAQRACYWRAHADQTTRQHNDDNDTTITTTTTATANTTTGRCSNDSDNDGDDDDDGEDAVPPWVLYSCVQDMCASLAAAGALRRDVADAHTHDNDRDSCQRHGSGTTTLWELMAHQSVQCGDALLGEPLDVVCARPRVVTRYRLPPWRWQLGLPALHGDTTCVLLRAEVRQRGRVVLTGTFFFTSPSLS